MINQALLLAASLLNLIIPPAVSEVIQHPIAVPVYAAPALPPAPKETIEEKIDRIALENKISTTSLFNLVKSESGLNPFTRDGDMRITCPSGPHQGEPVRARGLVQITLCYHPEVTDEQAYDPDFAITYAAKELANQTAWREHLACNCYTYMKTLIPHLPKMADIKPNIDRPIVGGLVLFDYHGKPHWGYITKITDVGTYQTYHIKEANFEACKLDERDVDSTDPHIQGYWISLWY